MTMRVSMILLFLAAVTGCGGTEPPDSVLGAYRFDNGAVVSIRPSLDGTLRARFFADGSSRRLYPRDDGAWVSGPGFNGRDPVEVTARFRDGGDDAAASLTWSDAGGEDRTGTRIGRTERFSFTSNGVDLHARLDLPPEPGPYPAVVLVHGSGERPGTRWLYNGDFFLAHGVAVLAYDKRGTGRSDGAVTFDFERLARDAGAAVEVLVKRDDIDAERIGLSGYSQGGWVAPLAASMNERVRFVLVSYGMVESPAEEARLETLAHLGRRGVAGDALGQADTLVTAAVRSIASGFEEGWEEFQSAKRRYGDAPWRRHLEGTPVHDMMRWPGWIVTFIAARRAPPGLDWDYDSTAILEHSTTPMAWLLGTDDRGAPNAGTIATLRALIGGGKPYELHLFDGADHGMLVFDERDDARRVYTGYHPGYYRTEVDCALRLSGGTGLSVVHHVGSIVRHGR